MPFGLAAPIALYYGLRAAGAGIVPSLVAGTAPPAGSAIVQAIRHRRIDALAVTVLTLLVLSAGMSVLAGSPRFLLAKDAALTAVWGTWFLLSLRGHQPAIASQAAGLDVRLSAGALPEHVTAVTVTVVTVLAGLAGWAVLALLERVVPLRARRTWTVLAAAVLAVSIAGPLDAGTTTATKIALTCMHLAAAGVLIPALARSSARP